MSYKNVYTGPFAKAIYFLKDLEKVHKEKGSMYTDPLYIIRDFVVATALGGDGTECALIIIYEGGDMKSACIVEGLAHLLRASGMWREINFTHLLPDGYTVSFDEMGTFTFPQPEGKLMIKITKRPNISWQQLPRLVVNLTSGERKYYGTPLKN